jgi:hypothetical protein
VDFELFIRRLPECDYLGRGNGFEIDLKWRRSAYAKIGATALMINIG